MKQETINQFVETYYETKDKLLPKHYPDWIVAIDAAIYKGNKTDFNSDFKHFAPVMDAIIQREREAQRMVAQNGVMIFLLFSPDYKRYPDIEDIEMEKCFDCKAEVQEGLLITHQDKRMAEIRVCEDCLRDIIWQEQKDAENE